MGVTHKPKTGPLLTGTEYEAADSHITSIAHVDTTGITATDHHAAPAAGPDANDTIDAAGAAGTASTFARSGHGHQVVTDSGVASTQAFGDAATAGTSGTIQRGGHKHAMPANPVSFAAPSLTLGTANAAGAASTIIRTDATILAFDATVPAAIGTAAVGAATVAARRDHVHPTGAGTPSTQAIGDAAATGSGPAAAMTDHKHAMPAFATNAIVLGTAAAAGAATTLMRSNDTIAAFDATTPSTQAFADAGTVGVATVASRRDHKHVMPTLGFGLTGNSAPAVSLTTASAFATATTSISAATYADVTGVTVTLASGTWLVVAQCVGSSVNAQAIMHVAITDASNVVLSEQSQGIAASGTASVAQLGHVSVQAIVVATGAAIKMRAARGLTTITGTWTAMDGAGTNTLNNLTDNSDKGTGIFAVRIA